MLILDASIGALGSGAPVLGAAIDVETALGGPGRVVLAASSRVRFRLQGDTVVGDPAALPWAQCLAHGLRSGAADLDGDGQVSIGDLARYVEPARSQCDAPGSIVIAQRAPAPRSATAPSRPSVPRRRSWASHAASSVASWFAEHVGL